MPLWQLQAPTAIALQLGAFSIRWYGVFLTLGIIGAYWLTSRLRRQAGQSMQIIEQLLLLVVISGIIGGRLLHVILEWSYYSQHLWQIPQIWMGGLAIHGAIIGGGLALYWFTRQHKLVFLPLLDQIVPGLALAQAIGRWGNYFNQELYGKPTTSWFGIYINEEFRIKNYELFSIFHPIFLYESVGLLVLAFILWRLISGSGTRSPGSGLPTAVYLIGYGVIRFLIGWLRIDQQLSFGELRFDQWESLIFIVSGIILWLSTKKRK